MYWSVLSFGKYAGKTLPEIILTDPDWFCYMLPKLYDWPREEADELNLRARAIRIPRKKASGFEVECRYDPEGRFEGVCIVKVGTPLQSRYATRLPYLDLLAPIGVKKYDKRSGRVMVRDFRVNYFGENKRITKKRCERFFSDDTNFVHV